MHAPAARLFAAPRRHQETERTDGFTLNGTTSVQSLASFYGFACPASEPKMSIGDFVARTCEGQPRVGYRTQWERVELVVSEIEDRAVRKVCFRILPLRDRRGPCSVVHARSPMRRSQDRITATPAPRPGSRPAHGGHVL